MGEEQIASMLMGGATAGFGAINPLLALIPTAARIGYGLWEMNKSAEYAKTPRPSYQISPALLAAVGNQERLASDRTAVSDTLTPLLDKRWSDNLRAGRDKAYSTGQLLGSTQEAYGANLDKLSEANYADLMNYVRQNEILNALLSDKLAPEQQKEWQWNKAMPYQQDMATSQHLREVAIKNLLYGIDTAPYVLGGMTGEKKTGESSAYDVLTTLNSFLNKGDSAQVYNPNKGAVAFNEPNKPWWAS